jgi:hypothetical protein
VNFAISTAGGRAGVDHLGIEAESADELAELGQRLDAAGGHVRPDTDATCCYARSDKAWTEHTQGTRWETFHTFGDATTYHGAGGESAPTPRADAITTAACCAPRAACG